MYKGKLEATFLKDGKVDFKMFSKQVYKGIGYKQMRLEWLNTVFLFLQYFKDNVGWGGECVTPVLVRSLKLSTLVHSLNWIGIQTGFHGFDSRTPTNLWFQKHLVKQLWPPGGCRRREGRLSTTLAAKGCVLSTKKETSFKWIDQSEWWWREEWWTSRESLWLPAIGTWGYPIRAYRC